LLIRFLSILFRSVVDAVRTILIWTFGIILTTITPYDSYKWENLKVSAISFELIGFVILLSGNLIYNEIIILPFARPPRI